MHLLGIRRETMRSAAVRAKVEHLIHEAPFRPFVISLENCQLVTIEHPENIAFQPGEDGSEDFYVLAKELHFHSSLSAITSIALLDEHAMSGGE
jgi:hypothetical protein